MIIAQAVTAEPVKQIVGLGMGFVDVQITIDCSPIMIYLEQYDLLVNAEVTVVVEGAPEQMETTQYPFAQVFRNIKENDVAFTVEVWGSKETIRSIETDVEGILINKIG